MKTIGIAIPTYEKHIPYLTELLDSLETNNFPHQVSISCSSWKESLQIPTYSFPVSLTITEEYKNPAQNRNIAASKLSTDYISFIDGDDLSMPDRTRILLEVIEHGSSIVCHNYRKLGDTLTIDNQHTLYYKEYIDTVFDNPIFPKNKFLHKDYHCAHLTILKSIFDKFLYDENENKKYIEDSDLLRRLVLSDHKIDYIENKLSTYRK